ncbi:MAG: NTP transferase domain-containing protein [Planctomycetota bacterium]
MNSFDAVTAVILAAGQGKRMNSDRAKVLHEVAGKAMVCHVIDTCRSLGIGQCVVVVGHQREQVEAVVSAPDVQCALQDRQLGTGHAVLAARPLVRGATTLVLCGDAPLVPADLLRRALDRRVETGAPCVAVAAEMTDPSGYGRMITDDSGSLTAIVEHKDANDAQRAVKLVNSGIFAFDSERLFACLEQVRPNNAQGEYYLVDVIAMLVAANERVELVTTDRVANIFGVNTLEDLTAAERMYRE